MMPHIEYELQLRGDGYDVVGVDEVGRGALAGPVLSAGICWLGDMRQFQDTFPLINDSKKLNMRLREELFRQIHKAYLAGHLIYSVSAVSNVLLDRINVLQATLLSMSRCVEKLEYCLGNRQLHALIDGIHKPKLSIPASTITRGDTHSYSIATASIVAKVYRDKLMSKLGVRYPLYKWGSNKGYPSLEHKRAIEEGGITAHHRRSFNFVRNNVEGRIKLGI